MLQYKKTRNVRDHDKKEKKRKKEMS